MIFRAIVLCTAGSLVMPTGAYKLKSEEKNYYFIIIFFFYIICLYIMLIKLVSPITTPFFFAFLTDFLVSKRFFSNIFFKLTPPLSALKNWLSVT